MTKNELTTDSARQIDENGFVEIKGNPISKVGIFPYSGMTLNLPDADPEKIYRVYRSAEELSSQDCIDSFKLMPIIDGHEMLGTIDKPGYTPPEKKGVDGVTGEEVYFENNYLKANLKIFSKRLLEKVKKGIKELSMGYFAKYEMKPGIYEGQAYDAIQTNIRGNHTAVVPEGRSGPDVAVLDHLKFTCDALELNYMDVPILDNEMLEKLMARIEVLEGKIAEFTNKEVVADTEKEAVIVDKDESVVVAEKKEDETPIADADTEEKEGEQDKPGKTMDAAELVRNVLTEINSKNKLAEQLSRVIGTFDHAEKSLGDVVKYGMAKLKLSAKCGEEYATLSGYLAAANRQSVSNSSVSVKTMDSKREQSPIDKFISELN